MYTMGMGKKRETAQIITAFKNWINDTPFRIVGWIMFVLSFISGSIILGTWLSKNLPPWYVWLAIWLVIVGVIGLSFIPYIKRLKNSHSKELGIIGAIEFEIIKGKQLQEKLKHSKALDIYLKGEFDRWFDEVGEYLQRKQHSEYAPWVRAALTSDKASLNDLVKAYDQGLNQLVDLQKRLADQLLVRKVI